MKKSYSKKKSYTKKGKRSFKRRSFKRKHGKRSNKSSYTKMHGLMPDKLFNTFKYETITAGAFHTGLTSTQAYDQEYAMIGYFGSTSLGDVQQFVFSTNYETGDNTGNALFNSTRGLPGNSLSMYLEYGLRDGFPDNFGQLSVTGATQYGSFYDSYICHGSAISVTVMNASVPGKLVVVPITTIGSYLQKDGGDFQQIIQFQALPEEQKYAIVKNVSASGGMDRTTIKHKMNTRKLYDIKNLTDDTLNRGLLTGNDVGGFLSPSDPSANQWQWYVGFIPSQPVDFLSVLAPQVTVEIKVSYFCELCDRLELPSPSNLAVTLGPF